MEAPERIYLQTGLEEWDNDPELTWDDLEEVTWCVDRINDNDVEYVLKDVAAALRQTIVNIVGDWKVGRLGRLLDETAWLADSSKERKSDE